MTYKSETTYHTVMVENIHYRGGIQFKIFGKHIRICCKKVITHTPYTMSSTVIDIPLKFEP